MESYLKELLEYALSHRVSDIYFYQKENYTVINMRNDEKVFLYDEHGDKRIVDYLRFITNMDMSGATRLQSGANSVKVGKRLIPIRFSYIALNSMSQGALRILEPNCEIDIDSLSLDKNQNKLFASTCRATSGLVLLSGATGSGKTTTLYALIDECKKQNRHVFTIEDPIEIVKEGIVQLQVKEPDLNYDRLIRQILRHDPDVVMLGEIRDSETAKMAVRASLTGHLVMSTIHAKNASGVIERLLELGVSRDELRSVLMMVSNQRLIKGKHAKICIYDILEPNEIERVLDGEHLESRLQQKLDDLYKKNLITKGEYQRVTNASRLQISI